MDLLNILGGICSIIGLLFSFWTTIRTGKISKIVGTSLVKERFRLNYDTIMNNLKSYALVILSKDFEISNEFLLDFCSELLSFKKSYLIILSDDEIKDIDHLITLLSQKDFNRTEFLLTFSKVISKPKYDWED